MIVVVKKKSTDNEVRNLIKWIEAQSVRVDIFDGVHKTVLGLNGDTSHMDIDAVISFDIVDSVKRIQEPYKLANRNFHPGDTVVDINGVLLGGGNFQIIAGPCSVESKEQMSLVASTVKKLGAGLLRGGAFKPRTSPYSFQGLEGEGIKYLLEARAQSDMPIVTELMSMEDIKHFEHVDVIQVGARNMQNFSMLKELGKLNKPVLLKRGLANTLDELLMSAEYIMAGGNKNVILCERGIRTFETATRNTLDISAVPILKRRSHLPVIVDPSHASGMSELVESLSLAAVAAGADGIMVEVHNDPRKALCDGAQSLGFEQFERFMKNVAKLRQIIPGIYES